VNCETDFVAKTNEFQGVVNDVAQTALTNFAKEGKVLLTVQSNIT